MVFVEVYTESTTDACGTIISKKRLSINVLGLSRNDCYLVARCILDKIKLHNNVDNCDLARPSPTHSP